HFSGGGRGRGPARASSCGGGRLRKMRLFAGAGLRQDGPRPRLQEGAMRTRSFGAAAVLAASVLAVSAAGSGAARTRAAPLPWPSPEQSFQMALEAQSAGDFQEMLALLRKAASQGHVEAQELLGLALLVGPTLYGSGVKADRCEAGLWLRKA